MPVKRKFVIDGDPVVVCVCVYVCVYVCLVMFYAPRVRLASALAQSVSSVSSSSRGCLGDLWMWPGNPANALMCVALRRTRDTSGQPQGPFDWRRLSGVLSVHCVFARGLLGVSEYSADET